MRDGTTNRFDATGYEATIRPIVDRINAALPEYLPAANPRLARFDEACRYALTGGGKRMRPLLTILACEAAGGTIDAALPIGCAFEFIHTYSLVHDDLPAMDDDELRRGRPTVHVKYDEATAILAGDVLCTHAFGIIAKHAATPELAQQLTLELVRASGIDGMVGGQVADIAAEGADVDVDTLEFIHHRKTGALLHAAVRAGARIGDGEGPAFPALDAYGRNVGLSFQVVDDILDVTATSEQLGKTAGKDADQRKMTYPAVHGLEGSRKIAEKLTRDALQALEPLGARAEPLRQIARYIQHRAH